MNKIIIMVKINKYIFFIVVGFLFLSIFSCNNKDKQKIIPQKTLSHIICEMYMIDSFLESHYEYSQQKDTSLVYEAIFNKYGYNTSDYKNSIRYYLTKQDSYKIINQKALDILTKREEYLTFLLSKDKKIEWPLIDSIFNMTSQKYGRIPLYRSIRWLAAYNIQDNIKISDTIINTDTPYYAEWWKNNVKITGYNFSINEDAVKDSTDIQKDSLQHIEITKDLTDTININRPILNGSFNDTLKIELDSIKNKRIKKFRKKGFNN